MTRNQLFSFAGFGIVAALVLPDPDGALDSIEEYQQCLGLYALGATAAPEPEPTTPTVSVETDDHSWFSFSPTLLTLPAKTPLRGQWVGALPPLVGRWTIQVRAPRETPAPIVAPPIRPLVVRVPLPPVAEPDIPARLLGVMRGTLPGFTGTFTGNIGDPDEDLLLMVASQLRQRDRLYLVDRRVVEEEWRQAMLKVLQSLS